MKKSPVALAIAVLVFSGWLTYLGMLALRDRQPVVSRAQLAVAQYDVEVELGAALVTTVTIAKVRWSSADVQPAGQINVVNLPETQGFRGAGSYLLPLVQRGGNYEVAGLPLDPSNPGKERSKPRIYPVGPAVLKQWDEIRGR